MVWQTQAVWIKSWKVFDSYAWLVFSATLLIYALHRLIGFTLITTEVTNRRIAVIRQYHTHIRWYASIAALACLVLVLQTEMEILKMLSLPLVLCALYVLPILNGKRWRDLPFIKVFTIALIWCYVTCLVTAYQFDRALSTETLVFFLEKVCFLLAITLPFDIRDQVIDQRNNVITFATKFGEVRTRFFAGMLALAACFLVIFAFHLDVYQLPQTAMLCIFYLMLIYLIKMSHRNRHDYFYSGVLDGSMIVQSLIVILLI